MKNNLIIFNIFLVFAISILAENSYKLCDIDELTHNFNNRGLGFFNEKTNIACKLADKQLTTRQVIEIVDESLNIYEDKIRQNGMSSQRVQVAIESMFSFKPLVLHVILKDYPEAIAELGTLQIYF